MLVTSYGDAAKLCCSLQSLVTPIGDMGTLSLAAGRWSFIEPEA